MRRALTTAVVAGLLISVVPAVASASDVDAACWGQATKAYAETGGMGEHSSQQATPRMGLHNLAVALYEAGVLSEPSLTALGAFVAETALLDVDACR